MKSLVVAITFFLFTFEVNAQFPPGAGQVGSTAIFKESNGISFWADTIIESKRGWLDIADTSLGKASFGVESNILGEANGTLYSFGDKGEVIVGFNEPIKNVEGFDFAIFENTFPTGGENEYFTELAFVEVSLDGINFTRFENSSLTQNTTQIGSFESINASNINNLAGKYEANYGTPFDLEEIGFDSIKYVKLIDVVGTINPTFASYDTDGNIINDPYPTAFESGGFDLDAVAAINQFGELTSIKNITESNFKIFPNPIENGKLLQIENPENKTIEFTLYNNVGKLLMSKEIRKSSFIPIQNFSVGFYIIQIESEEKIYYEKIWIR